MKKLTLSILVLGALFGTSVQANNTITFLGEVSDQTCEVAINGNAANPSVLLPTVSTAQLATAGSVAGETPLPFQSVVVLSMQRKLYLLKPCFWVTISQPQVT